MTRFEIRTAKNGQPYAVIVGANNRVVWQTETYKSKQAVDRAIEMAIGLGVTVWSDDRVGRPRRVVDRRN